MKLYLCLAPMVFACVVARASEATIHMTCVTEMPTTTIEAHQDKDLVQVHIYHHNGAKYAPISNSLITPSDLEMLRQRAEIVQKLGDEWNFKWKRSGCNADSAMFFQCIGEAMDFEQNGILVHPVALSVTEVAQKTMWGDYQHKNVALDFEVDKKEYRILMDYENDNCFSTNLNLAARARKGLK